MTIIVKNFTFYCVTYYFVFSDADLLMHTLENNDHKSDSYNIVNYFSNLFKSSSNSDLVSQDTVSSVSDSTFVGDSTSTDSLEA